MTSKFRNLLAGGACNVIKSINNDFNVANRTLAAKFRVRHDKNCSRIHFQFPVAEVKKFCDPSLFVREFEVNETVTGVDATGLTEKNLITSHFMI